MSDVLSLTKGTSVLAAQRGDASVGLLETARIQFSAVAAQLLHRCLNWAFLCSYTE